MKNCSMYFNNGNKFPTELLSLCLHWQCVSTLDGHLQGSSIKYIKGIYTTVLSFENRDISSKLVNSVNMRVNMLSNSLFTPRTNYVVREL